MCFDCEAGPWKRCRGCGNGNFKKEGFKVQPEHLDTTFVLNGIITTGKISTIKIIQASQFKALFGSKYLAFYDQSLKAVAITFTEIDGIFNDTRLESRISKLPEHLDTHDKVIAHFGCSELYS